MPKPNAIEDAIRKGYYDDFRDVRGDCDPCPEILAAVTEVINTRMAEALMRVIAWRVGSTTMFTPEEVIRRLAEDLGVGL